MPKVAIVMGSTSDMPIVIKAKELLDTFEVESELRVISAHRTPHLALDFATHAEERGIEVIIAAAGKAAHLAGIIAGITTLPVIGIPISTSLAGGLDSLLSVVQMPTGVPVATVAIDGAANSAILAVQILALKYPNLRGSLSAYKEKLAVEVHLKDSELNQKGPEENVD
jgi:5-(carboxyamino)imidazole ribonucleotide mutase